MTTGDRSDPAIVRIKLPDGSYAIVDAIDGDLKQYKWQWHKSHNGRIYARRKVRVDGKFKNEYLHTVILERKLGRALEQHEKPDHIDNDSLNNRRENLRPATHAQNLMNAKLSRRNKTGYKGVSYHKRDKLYKANIRVNGRAMYLGGFSTPEKAYAAYSKAALKYFGEFARLESAPPVEITPTIADDEAAKSSGDSSMDFETLAQAEKRTGIKASTFRHWIDEGKLTATKPGHDWLVKPEDVDAAITASRARPRRRHKKKRGRIEGESEG